MKIFGEGLGARPSVIDIGTIFHDTTTNQEYVFDNGQWEDFPQPPMPEPVEYTAGDGISIEANEISVKIGDGLDVNEDEEMEVVGVPYADGTGAKQTNALKFVKLTTAEYAALTTKDPDTVYFTTA